MRVDGTVMDSEAPAVIVPASTPDDAIAAANARADARRMSAPVLSDAVGLVVGVANKRSISWAIASAAAAAGARLALTYQSPRLEENVRELAVSLSDPLIVQCDVTNEAELDGVFKAIAERYGRLDFLVHGVAFADHDDLARPFVQTERAGFLKALDISVYSLVALTRRAAPLMAPRGGSILTLTYLGADRVFPNYNVMGVAKAALEATVRYLASDLGPDEHSRERHLGRSYQDAGGIRHFRLLEDSRNLSRTRATAPHHRGRGGRRRGRVPARPRGPRHHRRGDDGGCGISRHGDLKLHRHSSDHYICLRVPLRL